MLGVRRCYRRRRDQRLASSMNGSRSPRDRRQRFRSRNSVRRSTARVASPLHMRRFIGSWRFPKCFSTPMAACASTVASTRSSATRRGTCCGPTRDRNAIARRRKRRRWHKVVFPRFRRLPLARQRPRQSLSAISRARAPTDTTRRTRRSDSAVRIGTDHGSALLRRHLFDRTAIDTWLGFDNRRRIFPIHRSMRFVLLSMASEGQTDTLRFQCALSDPAALDADHEGPSLKITRSRLESWSPDLSIPEVPDATALAVLSGISGRVRARQ